MKIVLLPLLFCWLIPVKAQQSFMVYSPNGKVYVKKGSTKRMVKTGDLLKPGARLLVGAKASITLVCSNFGYFIINQPGSFLLSSFVDSCAQEKTGFSGIYFGYLWKQFTNPGHSPEKLRRSYMNNSGAVVRGCPGLIVDRRFDSVLLTKTDSGKLQWQTPLSKSRISFVLFDAMEDGNLLYEKKFPEKELPIDSIRQWLDTGQGLYWNIKTDGEERCSRKYLEQVAENTVEAIDKAIVAAPLANTSPAGRAFFKGIVLDYKHYIFKANALYREANLLEPLNLLYQAVSTSVNGPIGVKAKDQ